MSRHNILIIDCGSTKTPMIADNLRQLAAHTYTTTPLLAAEYYAQNAPNITGIVISGAPIMLHIAHNSVEYIQIFKWIKNIDTPVLGVCFGHQVLGLLYGGRVVLCAPDRQLRRIVSTATATTAPDILQSIAAADFIQDHTECIETITPMMQRTATSVHCAIEGIKIIDKPFWGVQFHPEVSGAVGLQLFANFLGE
jgi:GMP synthase (glutamine-hydrolysing)